MQQLMHMNTASIAMASAGIRRSVYKRNLEVYVRHHQPNHT